MSQHPLNDDDLAPLRGLALEGGGALAEQLDDPARADAFSLSLDDFTMDFTRQTITAAGLEKLLALAEKRAIASRRDAMMAGEAINTSEARPVLHPRLRDPQQPMARDNVDAMAQQVEYLLSLGVEDIVSIGIGGSDLGPAMVVQALVPFHQGPELDFVSNIDPAHLGDRLAMLNPVTTAFIIISKTFRTEETMANLAMARRWLDGAGVDASGRMVAVTANPDEAISHGFETDRILAMDEGVGGRFSLWSAVGLGIMAAVGREGFIDMLAGAETMDRHFASAPADANIPLIGGLLRFYHASVCGRPGQAIIPYDQRLQRLPAWMQQLEMESNGKSVTAEGEPVPFQTAPIIFGEVGSNAQHSFFQMLHQGPAVIPVDFLAPLRPISFSGDDDPLVQQQHRALLVNMVAQADALAIGEPEAGFPGGRPSTVLTWDETGPFALGRLLAYYEHLTAVHGWMLGLNSFDQPGVELGKRLAGRYQGWIGGDDEVSLPVTSRRFLARFRDSD